jgi:transketolase
VSTLQSGAELLRQEGIKVRIVSVPSEGLFREQPLDYQQSVVPAGAKVFGLTAGLPVNLQGFLIGADPESTIWGLNSFGFSAPYKVLDEKLGYTAENVVAQVKKIITA